MLRPYETTFLIDSLMRTEEIEETVRRYQRFISANGGDIKRIERWGKRRLAFEMRKRQYGYYVFIRYEGPPAIVEALEHEFRLDESILRYLTVQLDKRALQKEQLLIEQGVIKQPVKPHVPKEKAETKAEPEPSEKTETGAESSEASAPEASEVPEEQQPQDSPEPVEQNKE